MDVRLRRLVSKAAGTYFIVTDNSQVAEIESENKMRLYFISSEKGPVNMLLKFAKGDKAGYTAVYGKGSRLQEKKGNFSISTCLSALEAGPIAVINLRAFNETDQAGISGLNPNVNSPESSVQEYTKLFNTNGFWIPKGENITELLTTDTLLNFGNVGTSDISIFVTKAKDISSLTNEGEKSWLNSELEVDEYPALDFNSPVSDSFVDVYVFNNTFDPVTVGTNKYYGHLFNASGEVDVLRLDELTEITESGFVQKYTGSMIPNLKSENDQDISIDSIITNSYMESGIICNINDDLLETENKLLLDVNGVEFFDELGEKVVDTSNYLLSHVVPQTLTTDAVVYPPTTVEENVEPEAANKITYPTIKDTSNSFIGSFDQGIRIDDLIEGEDGLTKIESVEIIDENAVIALTEDTYRKVKYTCSGNVKFNNYSDIDDTATIIKVNNFTDNSLVKSTMLVGYKPRLEQFVNGSAVRQSEILDMMVSPGIVKGVKGINGIRYVVDCFKSFVEPDYKSQFGSLMVSLDEGNRFIRAIINEPFIEDLQKSTNPLFKQTPGGVFDISYLETGGNKTYSTKLLTKFALGASMCFFFGPGNKFGSVVRPLGGSISNIFYTKTNAFDVLANASGYIDGVEELEYPFDDDDRKYCELFNYNPVINYNGGNTIFGNLSGVRVKSALQQIHNSELLAYIKENLYNLSKSEAFKKGNYDDYLRTETEAGNFMESLATAGAIQANPVVICNASNNTPEIAKQKIKLVHIEYVNVDSLEKVVFDLQIN